MRRYATIKLLLIIPSLLLLSIIVFFLSKLAPGDPVASMIELRGQVGQEFNSGESSPEYLQIARELEIDLPLFYFSIHPSYYPDTLHKVLHPQEKKRLKNWLKKSLNWPAVEAFSNNTKGLIQSYGSLPDSLKNSDNFKTFEQEIKTIVNIDDAKQLAQNAKTLFDNKNAPGTDYPPSFMLEMKKWYSSAVVLSAKNKKASSIFPRLRFYGSNNQYHQWISKLIKMDMGISLVDARKVSEKIYSAFGWTFFYVMIAYILSLIIAIPLGLYNAWNKGKLSEKIISSLSFSFYAFPLFWIATLSVVFLTNDLYASWLNIFPGTGLGALTPNMSVSERFITALPYLILPALILALHSAASGIRIVRNSVISELKSDYFITAKAKGLKVNQILWRHIFPNSMLPIITLLVSSFPAALAGSVVLEVIFNIPGIGRLLFDSIHFMDWNVVFGIMLVLGLITFVFYLIGDLFYAYLNPKIKFDTK